VSDPQIGSGDILGLSRVRERIEADLGHFGRLLSRNAWATIVSFALVVGTLLTQLPKINIDASTENMLRTGNPIRVAYDGFREQFGHDQAVMVAIETEDVFDIEFLAHLRALHEALESELPYIDEVTSLVNVRNTRGEADGLVVGDLLEEMPSNDAELAALRARTLSTRLYLDQLISRDGRVTTIVVVPNVYSRADENVDVLAGFGDAVASGAGEENEKPAYLTPEENAELVRVLEDVVDRYRRDGLEIYLAGMPVMTDRLMRGMANDMGRFTLLALATITLALAVLFRRLAAVLLPLLVSALAMLTTLSIMAIAGIALTTITQIMPSFLLAVGVGSSVHILVIFYQATARGDSKEDAIAYSLSHSGLAVVMTSLTTAGGMASFMSASIAPVRDFGIITPIGILAALVFSLVLTPALLSVFPMRAIGGGRQDRNSTTRNALARWGDWAVTHPWKMVAIWTLILAQAAVGITRIEFSHDPISWFQKTDPLRVAMTKMNNELAGVAFLEAVVDTGREDGVRSPEVMNRLDEMHIYADKVRRERIFIGKTISMVDVVKETHQALNENRSDFYAIPQDSALLSQEILLFENSGADDLEDLVDSQFQLARFSMKIPLIDAIHYAQFIDETEERFIEIMGDQATVSITGLSRVMMEVVHALADSLIRTYILAFLVITPLMMLLLGSVRVGLLSMIPNLAPIVITLGVMGWVGIPLEIFTLMIGSVALGLAVDDTIHFMHNFRRYFEQSGDERDAVRRTLTTTGQALLFTSIVLSCGFFIYIAASMRNLLHFGMLTGSTIILAFLADLLLAPALMTLVVRGARRKRESLAEAATPG
jgi:predicted RND superfamily exporter protein